MESCLWTVEITGFGERGVRGGDPGRIWKMADMGSMYTVDWPYHAVFVTAVGEDAAERSILGAVSVIEP